MPRLIKQRYKGDCAVAALAMFLGKSYDEIISNYPEEMAKKFNDGVSNDKTFEVAAKYGVELTCVEDNFDLTIPCILIVPSLNLKGKYHSVFWNGKKLFDPANGLTYKHKPRNIRYAFQKVQQ